MYEIDVSYRGTFSYVVRSNNYELKVGLPSEGQLPAVGITPPALLLASLGSCLGVYLERYLVGAKIKFDSFFINVKSGICNESPRYLKEIDVVVSIQGSGLDEKRKIALHEFIKNCPIHNTLVNGPAVNISLEA